MALENGRKRLSGAAPALIKHILILLGGLIAGVFAMGLLYADVLATGKKADDNRERVEAIEQSINDMVVEQKVLIQRFNSEQKENEKFRDGTGSKLDRILLRLPRRERTRRND